MLLSHGAFDLVIKPVENRVDDIVEELFSRNMQEDQEDANVKRDIKAYQMRRRNRQRTKDRRGKEDEETRRKIRERKNARINLQDD